MFFFRVDSNSYIASGHVMRCLAIANILIKKGEKVCFLISDDNSCSILSQNNIDFIVLNSDWHNLMTDVEKVKKILKNQMSPILIVDTYSITKEYVECLKPYCKIVYLGSKTEYLGPLDMLISYSANIDYDYYKNMYSLGTCLLLGPFYAPLREEFQNVHKDYKDHIERILITTGNTDNNHIVDRLLKSLLSEIEGKNIIIDVVIGRMFDDIENLYRNYNESGKVCFHENVESMSKVMKECDLAVSANGTTVYELLAIGIPTITFAMVEEQKKNAEAMAIYDIIDYCGESFVDQIGCVGRIIERVIYYLSDNTELIGLAHRAHSIIDGNGSQRITDALICLK